MLANNAKPGGQQKNSAASTKAAANTKAGGKSFPPAALHRIKIKV